MKRKVLALIVTAIVVSGGLVGFFAYYYLNRLYLPVCGENPFTNLPVELAKLTNIVPLGNLNPPGHTFPTDHMYFFTNTTMYPDGFAIYAPGAIIINVLSKVEYSNPHNNISEDFTIDFDVCRNVWGKFGHVNNLSTYLWSRVGGFGAEYGDRVNFWQVAGDNFTAYQKSISLSVSAGQELGVAGWGGGYDFWLKDDRVTHSWVNSQWTQEFQHTVCPLTYFNASIRSALQSKLADWSGAPVSPANYCGRIAFDVPNTAQGIWTQQGYVGRAEDYGLSLVYSNFNASLGAISIGIAGNSSWDSRAYTFNPAGDGFRNRVFDEVTTDGNVYYYFCDGFSFGSGYSKVILLKMVADRQIRLQFIQYGGTLLPSDPSPLWNESNSVLYLR